MRPDHLVYIIAEIALIHSMVNFVLVLAIWTAGLEHWSDMLNNLWQN